MGNHILVKVILDYKFTDEGTLKHHDHTIDNGLIELNFMVPVSTSPSRSTKFLQSATSLFFYNLIMINGMCGGGVGRMHRDG